MTTLRTILAALPRWVLSLSFVLVLTGLGALGAVTSAPDDAAGSLGLVATAGGLAGLAVSVSILGYRRLVPRLGSLTSVAALAVVWALVWAVAVMASPQCPGAVLPGRCGAADLGSYLLSGVLFPVSLAMLVLPALFAGRVVRALVTRSATRLRASAPSDAPAGKDPALRSGNPAKRAAAQRAAAGK